MTGLRTIVVGFGQVASGLTRDARMANYFDYASHAAVLAAHPAFDWRGVVDPDGGALADARDAWGMAHCGPDLDEIAAKVRPEVAILAAPPGDRAKTVAGLPDLKAVLVEKPLNSTGEGGGEGDGEALRAVCAERSLPVLVNYWRRADRLFQELAAGGLASHVGSPQAVFGLYGNGLANNGGHLIDFLRMLLGEVSSVQALGPDETAMGAPITGDRNLPFALTFADGPVATLQPLDFHHYREVGLDIWGDAGRLSILQEGLSTRVFPVTENRGIGDAMEVASDAGTELERTVADSLYRMYDNLAEAAVGTAMPWSPLESALANERIIDAVPRSAAENGARLSLV